MPLLPDLEALGDKALLHRRRPIPTVFSRTPTAAPQILVIPLSAQEVCQIEFTWSELAAGDPLVRIPVWSNTPTQPSQLVFQVRSAFVGCSTISIQEVVNQSFRRLLPTHTTDECGREAYAFVRVPDICGGGPVEPPEPPEPPPPACLNDMECPAGMVCVAGECVPGPGNGGPPPPGGCPDWVPIVLATGGFLGLSLIGSQQTGREREGQSQRALFGFRPRQPGPVLRV